MAVDHKQTRRVVVVGGLLATSVCLLFWFYQILLVPLLLSMFIAYLLLPVVDFLDQRYPIHRSYLTLMVLLLVIGLLGLAVAGIVPVIKEQVFAIAAMLPKARDSLVESWLPWLREMFVVRFELIQPGDYDEMIGEFKFSSQLGEPAVALQNIFNQTTGVLGGVVNIGLVPVFSFFMLRDMATIRKVAARLVPADIMPIMTDFRHEVDLTLRNVLKRQLTVALILGVLYMFGLSVVGLKFSLAIGAIAGLCRVVPYLDVIVGGLLAIVVIVTDPAGFSWAVPIGVAIVFLVVQSIDGMIITPLVIGEKVGLHPAIVISSVFACGDWFGFAGVLLAIPMVAVFKIVLLAAVKAYRESSFYLGT